MADQCIAIEEQGFLSDRAFPGLGMLVPATSARVADAWSTGRGMEVHEDGSVADAVVVRVARIIRESGTAADLAFPTAHLAVVVAEKKRLRDAAIVPNDMLVAEVGHLADAARTGRRAWVIEQGALGDGCALARRASELVGEHARLRDSYLVSSAVLVAEQASLGDGASTGRSMSITETGSVFGTTLEGRLTATLIAEVASVRDAVELRAAARLAVMELGLIEDDVLLVATGRAVTTNTDSWGGSRYEGLGLNSLAVIGGRLVGAGPDGLYALEGPSSTTGDVPAHLVAGEETAGGDSLRRGGYVYASMVAAGPMAATVRCTVNGNPVTYSYPFEARPANAVVPTRAKFGKGLRSLTWQIGLMNVNGAHFNLPGGLKWVIDPGSRRV